MIPHDSKHPPFWGVLGTIAGPGTIGRHPIRLDYVPDSDDIASKQLLLHTMHVRFLQLGDLEQNSSAGSHKNVSARVKNGLRPEYPFLLQAP